MHSTEMQPYGSHAKPREADEGPLEPGAPSREANSVGEGGREVDGRGSRRAGGRRARSCSRGRGGSRAQSRAAGSRATTPCSPCTRKVPGLCNGATHTPH